MTYSSLFIGGHWTAPRTERTTAVISPASEREIGSVPCADPTDVDAAVAAARRAFDAPGWAQLDPADRADHLDRLALALEKRAPDVATAVTTENGMPISLSTVVEGFVPAAVLRYYADLARTLPAEERRAAVGRPGATLVRQEPVGVVAAIVPWNAPSLLTSFKLAPALAAGCTVVVKPSPRACLHTRLLAEAVLDAGLPPGVVNVVTGDTVTAQSLVGHPGVDHVAFTGSTATGRHIARTCGELLRPVTLELGGKSAGIVLDDADLAVVAKNLVGASLLNNGQWCNLSTRILAPATRYREVLDLVTDVAAGLVVGDPLDPGVHVGPLISAEDRDRVEAVIAAARHDGGTLTTGGGRPSDLNRGWYLDPTVIGGIGNEAPVAREEIFGPVLVVIPYTDEDDAVAIANDSAYGLAGTVFSADPEHALAVARRIRTGTVGINQYNPDLASPYGGVKASGIGRELGPEGLATYRAPKSIYLD